MGYVRDIWGRKVVRSVVPFCLCPQVPQLERRWPRGGSWHILSKESQPSRLAAPLATCALASSGCVMSSHLGPLLPWAPSQGVSCLASATACDLMGHLCLTPPGPKAPLLETLPSWSVFQNPEASGWRTGPQTVSTVPRVGDGRAASGGKICL